MTPEQFQSIYPHLLAWIRQTLADHANKAQTVASRGFPRLPLYFSGELLTSTKFVALERLPMPPLSALGLSRFAQFERGDFAYDHWSDYRRRCRPQDRGRALERSQRRDPGLDRDTAGGGTVRGRVL